MYVAKWKWESLAVLYRLLFVWVWGSFLTRTVKCQWKIQTVNRSVRQQQICCMINIAYFDRYIFSHGISRICINEKWTNKKRVSASFTRWNFRRYSEVGHPVFLWVKTKRNYLLKAGSTLLIIKFLIRVTLLEMIVKCLTQVAQT